MPRQINDSRFGTAEHKRQVYRATLETGTTLDEVCHPDFWRLLSAKIRPNDLIEAAWEDGSAFIVLYVRAAPGGGRLLVAPVAGGSFLEKDEDAPRVPLVQGANDVDVQDGIKVEYAGEHDLWRTVLMADGRVLKDKLPTQSEARRQRTVYLKTLGRAAA